MTKIYERLQRQDMTRHVWAVNDAGANVCVRLWIDTTEPSDPYGGIECCHHVRPSYRDGEEPDHPHCKWLGGKSCYHDGSSLAADRFVAQWKQFGQVDEEWVFGHLQSRLSKEVQP